MERIWVNLSDSILAQVQLSQLLVLLQVIDLGDFIIGSVKDFQVLHWSQLNTVEVVEVVVTDVKHFKSVETEETSWVSVLIKLTKK